MSRLKGHHTQVREEVPLGSGEGMEMGDRGKRINNCLEQHALCTCKIQTIWQSGHDIIGGRKCISWLFLLKERCGSTFSTNSVPKDVYCKVSLKCPFLVFIINHIFTRIQITRSWYKKIFHICSNNLDLPQNCVAMEFMEFWDMIMWKTCIYMHFLHIR